MTEQDVQAKVTELIASEATRKAALAERIKTARFAIGDVVEDTSDGRYYKVMGYHSMPGLDLLYDCQRVAKGSRTPSTKFKSRWFTDALLRPTK